MSYNGYPSIDLNLTWNEDEIYSIPPSRETHSNFEGDYLEELNEFDGLEADGLEDLNEFHGFEGDGLEELIELDGLQDKGGIEGDAGDEIIGVDGLQGEVGNESNEFVSLEGGAGAVLVEEDELSRYENIIKEGNFLGQRFESMEIALAVYNAFAEMEGFSIRKCAQRKLTRSNKVGAKNLVCSNQGERETSETKPKNRVREPKGVTRCNCKARLRIKYDQTTELYVVTRFIREHNHPLVIEKSLVPHLRSQRHVDQAHLDQAKTMRLSGIGTSIALTHFRVEKGGNKLGFQPKDFYNAMYRDKMTEIMAGDSNVSLAWLEGRKAVDKTFFFKYTVDSSNSLDNLFFADGRSRDEYAVFGDCLLFDATYKTNVYDFPLIILSGVNNHRRSCVFGTALVKTETIESYTWVLQTLMEAMQNKMPNAVITDGDKAMHGAIERVFPHARRRLCAWHLQKNAQTNVKIENFNTIFRNVIKYDCPTDEFDRRYWVMADRYNLRGNKWINETFKTRSTWADAYLRGDFFADCRSTQRCESLNAIFKKKYKNPNSTIIDLLKQYFIVLETNRLATNKSEYKTNHSTVELTTTLPDIEMSASKVLTRDLFHRFKKNLESQGALFNTEIQQFKPPNNRVYVIADRSNPNVLRRVAYNPQANHFDCDCMFTITKGYPCKHIVFAMKCEGTVDIPKSCFLIRWTPEISLPFRGKNLTDNVTTDDVVIRHGYLNGKVKRLLNYAKMTVTGTKKIAAAMDKLTEEAKQQYEQEFPNGRISEPQTFDFQVGDPSVAKPKGSRVKSNKRAPSRCRSCSCIGHKSNTCKKKREDQNGKAAATNTECATTVPLYGASYTSGATISPSYNTGSTVSQYGPSYTGASFGCEYFPSSATFSNGSGSGSGAFGHMTTPHQSISSNTNSNYPFVYNNTTSFGAYIPDNSSQNHNYNARPPTYQQIARNSNTSAMVDYRQIPSLQNPQQTEGTKKKLK